MLKHVGYTWQPHGSSHVGYKLLQMAKGKNKQKSDSDLTNEDLTWKIHSCRILASFSEAE